MYKIAKVAVERAAYHYDKLYSYYLPEAFVPKGQEEALTGCRVVVPFGTGNATRLGIILEWEERTSREKLKPIKTVVDPEPLLNREGLGLLRYLKETTFCSFFDGLKVLLPAGIGVQAQMAYVLHKPAPTGKRKGKEADAFTPDEAQIIGYLRRRASVPRETLWEALGITGEAPALRALLQKGVVEEQELLKRKIQDESILMITLASPKEESDFTPTAKQKGVIALLEEVGEASLKEVCYFAGVTRSVVDTLLKTGICESYEQEIYRVPELACSEETAETALSNEQAEAAKTLEGLAAKGEFGEALLYGVTGSGKTQVYLHLIDSVLQKRQKIICLVPEISLTPQTIGLFTARFGQRVAVLHSGLSMSQRMDEWKRIKRGLTDIVVGTRSAVFAPLDSIGLIIIDEEQEHTYRSEAAPRFDARDIAKLRCRYHKSLLLLCSATPSVESYHRATKGEIPLVTLPGRYGVAKLPDVFVIDQKGDKSAAEGFSQTLLDEIYVNLEAKEQTILLLNRRGHSTIVKCPSCGETAVCPHCSIALTYHAANGRLVCHYCGHSQELVASCEHCGCSYMRYSGLGTQKAEEILKGLFPAANILRMDTDTTMSRHAHERHLGTFKEGAYDIMIGTQMVAKGLDFPRVTLVGVLSADQALYSEDYDAAERAFSLITQVVGRCGRGEKPGRAYIQTYTPDNPLIEQAATQNYPTFFATEIDSRKIHLYPPFCRLYCIGISGEDQTKAHNAAQWMAARFAKLAQEQYPDLPVRLLGPAQAAVFRVAGRWRYKLLVKCKNAPETRALFAALLTAFGKEGTHKDVAAFVDPSYTSNY